MVTVSIVGILGVFVMWGVKKVFCDFKTKDLGSSLSVVCPMKRSFYLVMNQPTFVVGRALKKG